MFRSRAAIFAAALGVAVLAPSTTALAATSTDTHVEWQWGLDQIEIEPAWARTLGDGVTVAIVDSGVDLDHPDLAANLLPGATFSRCSEAQLAATTPCGNGDWLTPAFGDNVGNSADASHGTHVAGTVGAIGNNGIGVIGVAPEVQMLPVKVLDNEGSGFDDEIAAGIRWSVANGADVINMSIGKLPGVEILDKELFNSTVKAAIDDATAAGVVTVIAAGNETYPFCASPSTFDGAICVTSTDFFGTPSYFSNGGIKDDQLSVAAPGGGGHFCDLDILSTYPTDLPGEVCVDIGADYAFAAGTSMAAPHVAGTAALLMSQGCTLPEVHTIFSETSWTPGWGTGLWDPKYGYGIIDADAATAAAEASCTPPNAVPVAVADVVTTAFQTAVNLDVAANDTDADGDALTVSAVGAASNGSTVLEADGTVTYTPDNGFSGADSFTYDVTDGTDTSTGTVAVTVEEKPNTAPDAEDDVASTSYETAVNVDVLANDTDVDGDDLSVTAVGDAADGTAILEDDGTVTYTPDAGFSGTDSFTYTVTDGELFDAATVTVTVAGPPNEAPDATDDTASVDQDQSVVIDVLANDTDPDGDTLSLAGVGSALNGTAVANGDGTVTYTPDAGFFGTDQFTYDVTDGSDTSTATVTVTVAEVVVNNAPTANGDYALIKRNTAVTIQVLGNDHDPDGDALSVVRLEGTDDAWINSSGSVTYVAPKNFTGTVMFTYVITDGEFESSGRITIDVVKKF